MRMGLREVIGLYCLINGIAGRVVRHEDVQNKILGNQNNQLCSNVVDCATLSTVWPYE